MATHSSILVWKTPWTEEPGGLQSKGSPRLVPNWMSEHQLRIWPSFWFQLHGALTLWPQANHIASWSFHYCLLKRRVDSRVSRNPPHARTVWVTVTPGIPKGLGAALGVWEWLTLPQWALEKPQGGCQGSRGLSQLSQRFTGLCRNIVLRGLAHSWFWTQIHNSRRENKLGLISLFKSTEIINRMLTDILIILQL